jgi:hypothetical protein
MMSLNDLVEATESMGVLRRIVPDVGEEAFAAIKKRAAAEATGTLSSRRTPPCP